MGIGLWVLGEDPATLRYAGTRVGDPATLRYAGTRGLVEGEAFGGCLFFDGFDEDVIEVFF